MTLDINENNNDKIKIILIIIIILIAIVISIYLLMPQNNNNNSQVITKEVMTPISSGENSAFYIGFNTTQEVIVEKATTVETIVEIPKEIMITNQNNQTAQETQPKEEKESTFTESLLNIDYDFFNPDEQKIKKEQLRQLYAQSTHKKISNREGRENENSFSNIDDVNLTLLDSITPSNEQGSDLAYKEYQDLGIPRLKTSLPVNLDRVLTEGSRINVLLNGELNSELGGPVEAFAISDVYGFHGNKIIIPQGSIILGSYEPIQKIGQTRLNILWQRVIRPDGVSIRFDVSDEGFITTDIGGQVGAFGEIDQKFAEKYGLSILLSIMNSALQAGVSVDNQTAQTFASNVGAGLAQISQEVIQKNIDINPTVRIKKAAILQIRVMTDIWGKPKEGEYLLTSKD